MWIRVQGNCNLRRLCHFLTGDMNFKVHVRRYLV